MFLNKVHSNQYCYFLSRHIRKILKPLLKESFLTKIALCVKPERMIRRISPHSTE